MLRYFLPIILILSSCHVDKEEYTGIYENSTGNQITISCSSRFSSTKPFEQTDMPKNGEEVSVIVNEETYDICFKPNDVITSFGKWVPERHELLIQGVRYKWKKKITCK